MSKYSRKHYICRKKETPPYQKVINNHLQNCAHFCGLTPLADVINEWLQFICLCKKWINLFTVNRLNFVYFIWFVYTFVNYKYNVLSKRDDVCLIPLNTLVTLSRFDEEKEIRIVCSKIALKSNAKCCGNVAATLWLRLDNVGQRHCHNVGNRHRHNSHFRPCHNVVTTSTMTLWQLGVVSLVRGFI